MKNCSKRIFPPLFAFLTLLVASAAVAQQSPSGQPAASVAGNWTIYSEGEDGKTATQHIEVTQNGNTITGHFKGPYQSGGLEGTMNGRHIVFRTKTRDALTFRGMVDGNTIQGTFNERGRHGTWEASRPD